ncbi:MAG: hypothetical protein ACR2LM_16060 [Pyrinomonadaceae bacterium]
MTALAALRTQNDLKQEPFDESQFPIVEESSPRPLDAKEIAKRQLKAPRFRMAIPVSSNPNFKVAASIQHWPADFSAIPISQSQTIIVGVISDARAYVSEDKRAVYSEFTINTAKVIKDTCNLAEVNSTLTATRYGGRVRFPDGSTQLVFRSGLGMPRVGRRYLLFLKQTDTDYDLLTGYELRAGKVFPLDEGTPNFGRYHNIGEADFIKEVEQSIASFSNATTNQ